MVALLFTLDQALARGEVLAADTTESTHVIRVGEWVYKFLKPSEQFPPKTAAERRRQIQFRVCESWRQPELNSLRFDDDGNVLISRWVAGRQATIPESREFARHFRRTRRGYLIDITAGNVIVADARPVVVDFIVAEDHWEWIAGRYVSGRIPTSP